VLTLRRAGASAADVRRVTARDTPAGQMPAVMEAFDALLAGSGLVDAAGLFASALAAFDAEAPFVLDGPVVVVPGPRPRGLLGRLRERLADRCHVLPGPAEDAPLIGPDAEVDLFHAETPADEVREVLRRVLAEEARTWDEVEVVATDPDAYGVVLHGLATRHDIRLTSLTGVPMARTRTGRAVARVLAWLEDGLPADLLREALEIGELGRAACGGDPASPEGAALARALRRLRIGWGRKRYEEALGRLRDGTYVAERGERREDEDEAARAERQAAAEAEARALGALLERLLGLLPARVPERGSGAQPETTPATLARCAAAYLDLVEVRGHGEARARERHLSRLRRLAAVSDEPAQPFSTALGALREALSDLRAWPLAPAHGSPRSAAGGALHLTDLEHAGTTGRPRVFVVGPDADRRRLNAFLGDDSLATTSDRVAERRALVRRVLGGLAGRVTLSCAAASAPDGSRAGPSWVMLEALRADPAHALAGYDDLRAHLGEPASAAPRPGHVLDDRDVWLGALAAGPVLLDGVEAVREAFPDLARGLSAVAARAGDALTEYHGHLPSAAGRFDPVTEGRPISPTSLQTLAECPRRWFYRYAVGLKPPDAVAYDPEVWLDARDTGTLLHRALERFVGAYRERQAELADEEAWRRLEAVVRGEIARWRRELPPPGEAVFDAEVIRILEIARGFLDLEREQATKQPGTWLAAEYGFGSGERTVALPLPDGRRLPLQGFVDRVDRLANGTLRVIDYKTGSIVRYLRSRKDAPLKGGRTLQAALYAHAVTRLLGATVTRSGYWFPKVARAVEYGAEDLRAGPATVASLLEHLADGTFVPTTEAAACGFCDYAAICRASRDERFGTTTSPLAAWAKAHAAGLDAYRGWLGRNPQARPKGER
jgi:ATP-dependent helicase/nuclease subunit B